jgi:hypothetical protein
LLPDFVIVIGLMHWVAPCEKMPYSELSLSVKKQQEQQQQQQQQEAPARSTRHHHTPGRYIIFVPRKLLPCARCILKEPSMATKD